MDIQWHGLSCFSLKGKHGTVVIDPYDGKLAGITPPRLSADIVLANEDSALSHAVSGFSKEACVFDWPGEYESKGIIVQCILAYDRPLEKEEGKKDNAEKTLIYALQIDGFKLCHLGMLGHKLTTEMIGAIGDVDVLMIPVGGVNCLDAKKAHEVIEQLDPRVVIPMYYKIPGIKLPLAEFADFAKELGLHAPVQEKVLKLLTAQDLPQEHTEFKVLEAVTG